MIYSLCWVWVYHIHSFYALCSGGSRNRGFFYFLQTGTRTAIGSSEKTGSPFLAPISNGNLVSVTGIIFSLSSIFFIHYQQSIHSLINLTLYRYILSIRQTEHLDSLGLRSLNGHRDRFL